MYAIVKTGGKQYKVAPGDKINVEKIPGAEGDVVKLDAICIVDGSNVEADPKAAAKTKVEAKIVEQFRDKKVLVFKFKKRKNYKKLQGHRQDLTRLLITAVGSDTFKEPADKAAKSEKKEEKAKEKPADKAEAEPKKTAAKKAAPKKAEKAEPAKKATKTASKAKAEKSDQPKEKAAPKSTKADEKPADEKTTEE